MYSRWLWLLKSIHIHNGWVYSWTKLCTVDDTAYVGTLFDTEISDCSFYIGFSGWTIFFSYRSCWYLKYQPETGYNEVHGSRDLGCEQQLHEIRLLQNMVGMYCFGLLIWEIARRTGESILQYMYTKSGLLLDVTCDMSCYVVGADKREKGISVTLLPVCDTWSLSGWHEKICVYRQYPVSHSMVVGVRSEDEMHVQNNKSLYKPSTIHVPWQ